MQAAPKTSRPLEELYDRGIKVTLGEDALDPRNARRALKTLGDLVERRYPGLDGALPAEIGALIEASVHSTLRQMVAAYWGSSGISVGREAPIHSGGFSWIVKVTYRGAPCALAVPKFTRDDYRGRIETRARASEVVPHGIGFEVPRVSMTFDAPVPACLMTYVTGENCYSRCFDKDGRSLWDGPGKAAGASVFRKLGEMARGYTSIRGPAFGPLTDPRYASAAAYVDSYVGPIEERVMKDSTFDLSNYGITRAQLWFIIEWVRRDAEQQTGSHLLHGDLSPWNLLHDRTSDVWTITDGDDARFAIEGEQIGVCLTSMRGNYNPEWINAIADGYGVFEPAARRRLLTRGAAYGAVTYGLHNVSNALIERDDRGLAIALEFMKPCLQLFFELA